MTTRNFLKHLILLLVTCFSYSFVWKASISQRRSWGLIQLHGINDGQSSAINVPNSELARLSVICSGKSSASALFRASLKKELCFYRGCSGVYSYDEKKDTVEIVSEGRTKQLARFIDWLTTLSRPMIERKPNFQGPPLVIAVDRLEWLPHRGDLAGFSGGEAPAIALESDAKNMAGVDESV